MFQLVNRPSRRRTRVLVLLILALLVVPLAMGLTALANTFFGERIHEADATLLELAESGSQTQVPSLASFSTEVGLGIALSDAEGRSLEILGWFSTFQGNRMHTSGFSTEEGESSKDAKKRFESDVQEMAEFSLEQLRRAHETEKCLPLRESQLDLIEDYELRLKSLHERGATINALILKGEPPKLMNYRYAYPYVRLVEVFENWRPRPIPVSPGVISSESEPLNQQGCDSSGLSGNEPLPGPSIELSQVGESQVTLRIGTTVKTLQLGGSLEGVRLVAVIDDRCVRLEDLDGEFTLCLGQVANRVM